MEYNRRLYTKEELRQLEEWFAGRDLPEEMHLDKAAYIPDLKETVSRLCMQAETCYENPKMQGCIILLERIKEKLGNEE